MKRKYKSKFQQFLSSSPLLGGFITFLILSLSASFIISQCYRLLKKSEQQEARHLVQSSQSRLKQALDNALTATQALSFIITKDGIPENFDSAAAAIIGGNEYIQALQLAPGGITKYVYPAAERNETINNNVLADTLRNKEAYHAIKSKEIFFTGPFHLKYGRRAVIGYLPVYINQTFWGFSAAVIQIDQLIKAAGMDTSGQSAYHFQLSKINTNTPKEEFFLPPRNEADKKFEAIIALPGGNWKVAAFRADKYRIIKALGPAVLINFLFSVLAGVFVYYLLKRPSKLEKMVQERTSALQKSETRFRSIFNTQFQLMGLLDLNGNLIEINQTALNFSGYRYEEVIGKPFWHMQFNRDAAQREKNIEYLKQAVKKAAEGTFIRFEVSSDLGNHEKTELDISITPVKNDKGEVTILVLEGRNITSMKKARKNLQYILGATSDDFYVIDKNFRITLINESAEKNLEKAWGKPVTTGTYILDLIPAEKKEFIKNNYERAFRGEKFEYEIYRPYEGKEGWMQVNYLPVSDEDGQITGVCIITKDITEQKRAEIALVKSKEKFEQIAFATNDALWETNYETGETWWNYQHYQFYGHDPSLPPLTFEEWEQRIHPDDREKIVQGFNHSAETQKPFWESEYRFRLPGDIYAWVYDRVFFYYREGRLVKMIGSMSDITDRKKSEEKAKESEETRKLIMESALDAIVGINTNGEIIIWTPQAEKIFGWSKEEITGKKIADTIIPHTYRQQHIAGLNHLLQTGEGPILGKLIEISALHKQGQEFPVELNITPLQQGNKTFFVAFIKDISERKKVQASLEESERKLRQVLSSMADNFYVIDKDYNIILINDSAEKNLEKAWGKPVKAGINILDVIPPDGNEPIKESFEKVFKGEKVEYEFSIAKPGLPYWVLVNFAPVTDEKGNITGAYVTARDISERKKAEALLKESEEKYRSFIEQATDGIVVSDPSGHFIEANDAALKLFGYTRDEFLYKSLPEILVLKENDPPLKFKELREGKSIFSIRTAKRKDGSTFILELNGKMLPNGNLLGFGRDISERIRVQQQLEKEKELSDYIINSLPGVFYFYDYTGKFLRWNKRFEEVTGYTWEEVSKMHPLDFFEGEDKEYIRTRIAEVFEKGISDAEALFKTKSGKKIPYYFTGALLNVEGTPCLLGTGIDITARKEAEEKINSSYTQIRQLTEYLQNIREQERTHIAREIHDELGQQLTVLKMDISWLARKLSSTDTEVKNRIESLLEIVDNMVRTIRKISSELRPSMLDDLGLVPALEWHSQEFERRTGIKTVFTSDLSDLNLSPAVATSLFRIYQESLTNVARHSEATCVDAALKMEKQNILMSINDNGKGFTVTGIESKKTLGILGMRERALMMGGEYKISSTPGKGTQIEVVVPVNNIN